MPLSASPLGGIGRCGMASGRWRPDGSVAGIGVIQRDARGAGLVDRQVNADPQTVPYHRHPQRLPSGVSVMPSNVGCRGDRAVAGLHAEHRQLRQPRISVPSSFISRIYRVEAELLCHPRWSRTGCRGQRDSDRFPGRGCRSPSACCGYSRAAAVGFFSVTTDSNSGVLISLHRRRFSPV